jgi:1,4-dihydroxy-2-naphthoate octaprenyltransferase
MTTLYMLLFLLLVVVMIVMVALGVHQLVAPLVLIVVLPFLIFVGGRRKMVRSRSKPKDE